MSEELSLSLAKLSAWSIFVPFILAIVFFRRFDWSQKRLAFVILLGAVADVMAMVVVKVFSIYNNLFIFHIYTLIEVILIGLIYRKVLGNVIGEKTINILLVAFSCFAVFSTIFLEPLNMFNAYTRAVESLLMIFFSVTFFYKIMKEVVIQRLEKLPLFWISVGLLIYFSASLFIFIFSNYIMPSIKLSYTFWGIHAILNVLLNLFYIIALSVNSRGAVK
ncbi:MAG: hypothetical protein AAFV95_14265 [Bacteroidota bacterium]